MISPLAEKRGIKLIDTLNCGSRISVRADRVRLKQVLINLLSNAVKYNREGGHINLSCGCDSDSRDQVCLTVGDTGKGIPFEQIESLFTPFNRLGAENSEVEGTGIGLVITKQLVEMMGGEVGCESTPGEGSQFTVSFPLDESLADEHEDVSNSDEEAQAEWCEKYSVLYVEDNPANIRLMNTALVRRGNINLMTAHTAELGLDLAEAHQPDVIILDINLPGISGMEALERIKVSEKLCNTPVIALSADAMQSSIDRGLEAGFYRYLTKPIDIQALFESLDASIEAAREQ
ncbi:hybrid sensor histidine kinase/response regulator [Candidatus Reidiella endopervernicosa]|uniref:histidine kinase n=1 Tax=Candidatus Reidiella endopervernicosa TaxID=2738883 RepID=A0A6N0HRM1_9GAMM|nr:ATP-binding protein [Candidatus Reidiella endopervernicosa]QKQ24937.1 response regulator [Candidatus Reidiella endopervernicosa]